MVRVHLGPLIKHTDSGVLFSRGSTQVAEEAPLLRVYVVNAARGFKSLLLRYFIEKNKLFKKIKKLVDKRLQT